MANFTPALLLPQAFGVPILQYHTWLAEREACYAKSLYVGQALLCIGQILATASPLTAVASALSFRVIVPISLGVMAARVATGTMEMELNSEQAPNEHLANFNKNFDKYCHYLFCAIQTASVGLAILVLAPKAPFIFLGSVLFLALDRFLFKASGLPTGMSEIMSRKMPIIQTLGHLVRASFLAIAALDVGFDVYFCTIWGFFLDMTGKASVIAADEATQDYDKLLDAFSSIRTLVLDGMVPGSWRSTPHSKWYITQSKWYTNGIKECHDVLDKSLQNRRTDKEEIQTILLRLKGFFELFIAMPDWIDKVIGEGALSDQDLAQLKKLKNHISTDGDVFFSQFAAIVEALNSETSLFEAQSQPTEQAVLLKAELEKLSIQRLFFLKQTILLGKDVEDFKEIKKMIEGISASYLQGDIAQAIKAQHSNYIQHLALGNVLL